MVLLNGVEDDGHHLVVDSLVVLSKEEYTDIIVVIAFFLLEGLPGLLLPTYFHGDSILIYLNSAAYKQLQLTLSRSA